MPKIESLEMVDIAIENYTANVCDHFTVGLQFRKLRNIGKEKATTLFGTMVN